MAEKVFWKSALKASVLVYFFIVVFGILQLAFLGPGKFVETLNFFSDNREAMDSLQVFAYFLAIFQVFYWVGFAWLEDKIPLKSLFAKVFLFNAVASLLLLPLFFVPAVNKLVGFFLPVDFWFAVPIWFLAETFAFYFLYKFFKAKESTEIVFEKTGLSIASGKRRIAAYLVDAIILTVIGVAVLVLGIILGIGSYFAGLGPVEAFFVGMLFFSAISFFAGALYWTLLESRFGASIGKKLLKLRVVKENGEKISLKEAFFRNVPKFLSGLELVLLVELAMVFSGKKKQRIFDKAAGTVVVNEEKRQGLVMV